MRKHVEGHILRPFHGVDAPNKCTIQPVGDNACGFCGLDGCLTQLLGEKKDGSFTITSKCPYHLLCADAILSSSSICKVWPMH